MMMKNKPKAVENILRQFWRSESQNGACHACIMVTNINQTWVDATHHKMTIEDARDKILEIFEEAKPQK